MCDTIDLTLGNLIIIIVFTAVFTTILTRLVFFLDDLFDDLSYRASCLWSKFKRKLKGGD